MTERVRIFCSDCSYWRWGYIDERTSIDCPECPEGQLIAEDAESPEEVMARIMAGSVPVLTSKGVEQIPVQRFMAMVKAMESGKC